MANLQNYADIIHAKGVPLNNCWGFIDGTVRPVSRPGKHPCTLYNRHKRIHAIKFQSVVAPNGLITNLYGPVIGKRHDSGMLAESGLLGDLQHSPDGQPLCVWRPSLPYKCAYAMLIQRSSINPSTKRVQCRHE